MRSHRTKAIVAGLFATGALTAFFILSGPPSAPSAPAHSRQVVYEGASRSPDGRFTMLLDGVPERLREATVAARSDESTIEKGDYVADVHKCARCHAENYKKWSRHAHRFMNAAASEQTVVGDFSGAEIRYMGGIGRFEKAGGRFLIAAERGDLKRLFRVTRTIGSRFFQYYVGVQIEGPEPASDDRYRVEQVLPFGYWIDRRRWVPVVHVPHIGGERADGERMSPYEDLPLLPYDRGCFHCHTTLAHGDWLLLAPEHAGWATPVDFFFDAATYLKKNRPDLLAPEVETAELPLTEYQKIYDTFCYQTDWRQGVVKLGVTCEACHNGCRAHLENPRGVRPRFFPSSPSVLIDRSDAREEPFGRTTANINWICGRCHHSPRPTFPNEVGTWNSAEHRDAMLSPCYQEMSCLHCHDPHESIGPKWTRSADADDQSCLACHEQFAEAKARFEHTRHQPGTEGDRCMNCHMPRVNEGLQDVVRTHAITLPTDRRTIERNGPNACNLCHLDRSIDWTLDALSRWHGRRYDAAALDANYPDRAAPMGLVWLRHRFPATRLVAAAALGRRNARWALDALVDALDDPVLLNRQFVQIAVERLMGVELDRMGYWFYMTGQERQTALDHVRDALSKQAEAPASDPDD